MSDYYVLIIDDEEDICKLLTIALEKKNFNVSSANTIKEGLNLINQITLDYLFLDVNLPDGSGLDIIASVRKKYSKAGIVVISAYDNAKDKSIALRNGADFYISKPFNNETIYNSISNIDKKNNALGINPN